MKTGVWVWFVLKLESRRKPPAIQESPSELVNYQGSISEISRTYLRFR